MVGKSAQVAPVQLHEHPARLQRSFPLQAGVTACPRVVPGALPKKAKSFKKPTGPRTLLPLRLCGPIALKVKTTVAYSDGNKPVNAAV
jgi:hypothetical protein